MYFANLRPFAGLDEIIADDDFSAIYRTVISAARGAFPHGTEQHVFIMRENVKSDPHEPIDYKASTPICGVFKWGDDTISVCRSADLKHLFLQSGKVL